MPVDAELFSFPPQLYLHLQSIEDLPSKGQRENVSYDPVVVSCLLPDCKHMHKSKAAKPSLNPVFDDTVVFPLDRTKSAENVAVRISVYESDDLCNNGACTTSAIGHVLLPVVDCLTPNDNAREFRRRVGRRSTITGNLGRLLVSLAYLPSLERLSCVILRAKEIKCEKGATVASLETYVKVTLMCGVDKVKSRKTAIIRGTDSPVYTESLCFVVPMAYIDETSLVIQVVQRAQLKKDRILGQVILGPYIYTQGSAISHWGKMLARREAAKQWHNLYL
ncbi:synaptotagmin-15-like [Diadema antillarum]|uniref:synaptotagmin-15-like n=1 Tax=Diadema antillarum TaxID=105358 RepID=UPI003A87A570